MKTKISTFYKVYLSKISLLKNYYLKNWIVTVELASFPAWKTRNLQRDPWRCILLKNFYEAIKFIVVVARFILGMMSHTKDNSSLLDGRTDSRPVANDKNVCLPPSWLAEPSVGIEQFEDYWSAKKFIKFVLLSFAIQCPR